MRETAGNFLFDEQKITNETSLRKLKKKNVVSINIGKRLV